MTDALDDFAMSPGRELVDTEESERCSHGACRNKRAPGRRSCEKCLKRNAEQYRDRAWGLGSEFLIDRGVPECLKPENLPKKPPTKARP